MCCHSIQLVNGTMYIAISAAGAFRSEDGGETWTPINKDVAADFHPEKYPEVGQCVHKLLVHPAKPDGCGSRTTAVSIARTTEATTGSGWTETDCRRTSVSRSRWTPRTRTSLT